MKAQVNFHAATALFYQTKYQDALYQINIFLNIKPKNSMAYNNRALINYKMNRIQQSRQDMFLSLQICPNNYIAYFNFFSIQYMQGNIAYSLDNLQCCLSSLNMICGKIKKNKEMVYKSLQMCNNNFQALVLLILMEINSQNYHKAFQLISKYQKHFKNDKLNSLYDHLQKIKNKYSIELEEQLYELLEDFDIEKQRLRNSTIFQHFQQEQYASIVHAKLIQFNKLYVQVNKLLNKKIQPIAVPIKPHQEGQNQMKMKQKDIFRQINSLPLIVIH